MILTELENLTVVQVEQIARAFLDTTYVPPKGVARDIFKNSTDYPTKYLTEYLNSLLGAWR